MQQINDKIVYIVLCKDTIGIKHNVDKVFINFSNPVAVWSSLGFACAYIWNGSMYAPNRQTIPANSMDM